MNFSYFISKRISKVKGGSFSASVHNIAVASIAIGLAIMIVSFLILGGFRKTITNKVFNFAGHLQIFKYTPSNSYEPVSTNIDLYKNPKKFPFIKDIQVYGDKAGLLKTDEEVLGVLFKGVGNDGGEDRIKNTLIEGEMIDLNKKPYSSEILISKKNAQILKLKPGDEVVMYFLQNPPRYRKLKIKGVYNVGMEDFDEKIIIGDINLIRRLNNWPDTLAGGFEVFLKDFRDIDKAQSILSKETGYDLYVEKITDLYIQIFDWLKLLHRNVIIFLGLILFVSCFNMISILFILIMERTQMIGLLKALGSTNRQIHSIFISNGIVLIGKGLAYGNFIALGFGFLQDRFKLISLDPENYYMDFVPIDWNWEVIILLNVVTFLIVSITLLFPAMIISRVKPIKAIRFN